VANCGFESGNFSGWTLSGYDSAPGYNGIDYGVDAADAHSGSYGAYLGGFGGVLNLSQVLNTAPGEEYTVSFWLAQAPAPITPYLNSFTASFGSGDLVSLNQAPDMPFTEYTFSVSADSALAPLSFRFRDDLGFFSIDDISVTAAVPEPAAQGLWIAGGVVLVMLAFISRFAGFGPRWR
jgi:hypothetical protein